MHTVGYDSSLSSRKTKSEMLLIMSVCYSDGIANVSTDYFHTSAQHGHESVPRCAWWLWAAACRSPSASVCDSMVEERWNWPPGYSSAYSHVTGKQVKGGWTLTCWFLRERKWDRKESVACWAVVAREAMAQPQSFGSKWRLSEGGVETLTTRQLCLLGFHEAGAQSQWFCLFTKRQ